MQLLLQGTWPDGLSSAEWAGKPKCEDVLCDLEQADSCNHSSVSILVSQHSCCILGVKSRPLVLGFPTYLISCRLCWKKLFFFSQFWGQFLSLNVYQCMASHNSSYIFEGFARTSEDGSLLLNILPSALFTNIEISDLAPPGRGKL